MIANFLDYGRRQVRSQRSAHRDGTSAGAPCPVRPGEGLVHVVVHHVDAEIARPGDAQNGVHVGAIEVDERAPAVQHLGHGGDLVVEQAEGVRVGDHEHRRPLVELGFEIDEIDQPAVIALDADGIKAGDGGARGIGAVGAVGDEHARSLLAPLLEISGGDQQSRELAMSAGGRL